MESRFETGRALAERVATRVTTRITENRAVRRAAEVAVVPAYLYLIGVFTAVFPTTREIAIADALVAVGSLVELTAEKSNT